MASTGRPGPGRRIAAVAGAALCLVLGQAAAARAQTTPTDPYSNGTVTTSVTTTKDPPAASQETAATSQSTLPVTGGDVVGIALLGLGTAATGGGLVLAGRRRRNREFDA